MEKSNESDIINSFEITKIEPVFVLSIAEEDEIDPEEISNIKIPIN